MRAPKNTPLPRLANATEPRPERPRLKPVQQALPLEIPRRKATPAEIAAKAIAVARSRGL